VPPRIATAQVSVGATSGGVVELALPERVGQVIVPMMAIFINDNADQTTAQLVGLNHNLSMTTPANLNDALSDPNTWVAAGMTLDATRFIDVRGFGFELGGPQSFWARNEDNATRVYSVKLWYEIRRVGNVAWAAVKRATSFEDV